MPWQVRHSSLWWEENHEKSPDWTHRWLDEINIWRSHKIPSGATIATSHQSTASKAKKQLEEKISLALKSIDSRMIWGEYKVWIFRNYVVPLSRFLQILFQTMASDLSRALPRSLLKNGSDFPEMQRKRSFSTQRPSIVHIFQLKDWRQTSPN